jgi:hypothetical protein
MITSRGNARHMHMRAPPDTPTHSITLPARFGCLYVGLEWASNNCVFLWQACFLKDQRGGGRCWPRRSADFLGDFPFFSCWSILSSSFFFVYACGCALLCLRSTMHCCSSVLSNVHMAQCFRTCRTHVACGVNTLNTRARFQTRAHSHIPCMHAQHKL